MRSFGSYRFLVTLGVGDAYLPPAQALLIPLLASGGFQEVSGLGAELEVTAYPEGGVNDFVHQLPVRHSWGRIVLSAVCWSTRGSGGGTRLV